MSSDDFLSISLLRAIYLVCHLHPSISSVLCGIQYKRRLHSGAQTVSQVPVAGLGKLARCLQQTLAGEFLRRPRVPTNCVRHRCRQYSNCHTTIAR